MKWLRKRLILCILLSIAVILGGCSQGGTKSAADSTKPPSEAPKTNAGNALSDVKLKTMTKVKIGSAQLTTLDVISWFVGIEKGIFQKYNLDVSIEGVDGGVVALRGLQSGSFDLTNGLPENIISGVSKGADMKIIGALAGESLFKVFVTPNIQKIEDLKGKAAAVLQPGNGTDMQMRWWLKKHGLEPDKDVRVISAGGNAGRLAALKTGQAQVTLFTSPTDTEAERAGLKEFAVMKDELKSAIQDAITASGKIIREKPEVLRAFMAATAESIVYTKDPKNLDEVVQIGVKNIGFNAELTKKGLEFVIPTIPEKAKLSKEGINLAMETTRLAGALEGDLSLDKVIDESFYAK